MQDGGIVKAAKQPPAPELVGEACVVVDIVSRWIDNPDKPIVSPRRTVQVCKVCGAEYDHAVTCQTCAPNMLSGMAPESEITIVRRVVLAAVADYLRLNPRARNARNEPWAWIRDDSDTTIRPNDRDWNIVCLFCRADINTVGARKRVKSVKFWEPVQKHTWKCAALHLSGLMASKAPKRNESRIPVAKLKGKVLTEAACEAAEYMGVPPPIPRRRGSGQPCTGAYWQRRMVADARKLADARMRLERDGGRSELRRVVEQGAIDRLRDNILSLYVPLCLKSMGCLCAAHARGYPPTDGCDTREVRP